MEVLDETAPTQSQRDTFGMSKARKQEWEEVAKSIIIYVGTYVILKIIPIT